MFDDSQYQEEHAVSRSRGGFVETDFYGEEEAEQYSPRGPGHAQSVTDYETGPNPMSARPHTAAYGDSIQNYEEDEGRRGGSQVPSTPPLMQRPRTEGGPRGRHKPEEKPRPPFAFNNARILLNFIPPSARYREIEMPPAPLMARAATPPNPTLPRRAAPSLRLSSTPVMTTRFSSSGKQGSVNGKNGGKYQGDVLAGRPHGYGHYWMPRGGTMWLQYEGNWQQGMRQGHGTLYYWTNEVYHGEFVANKRHGNGRMEYKCGDVYEGAFQRDRKHGMGSQYFANGDCFTGFFCQDKREGLGTMYWLSKAKKYDGEWSQNRPCTGAVIAMSTNEEELLSRRRCDLVPISQPMENMEIPLPLPKLGLKAPSKIVFGQTVDVRKQRYSSRGKEGAIQRTAQKLNGTLDDSTMERLKHSFIALAGGDTPKDFIRPAKIGDVCVLAGLDPASPEVPNLLRELHEHSRRDARLSYDDFLNVLTGFRCIMK